MRFALILMFLFIFSTPTQALTCGEVPSCESLGFSNVDNPDCPTDGYLYCPFDKSYKKCVVKGGISCKDHTLKECPEGATDCTLCGKGKLTELAYKVDGCKEGYKLENDTCVAEVVATTCEVGDVYYLDKTCGKADDFDGSKTPIGVVFYVENGGQSGKIVNLKNLTLDGTTYTFNPEDPYGGTAGVPWGLGYVDSGTASYGSGTGTGSLYEAFKNNDADLYDGKNNTALIAQIQFNDSNSNCTNGNFSAIVYAGMCVPTAANAALAFYPVPQAKGTDVGEGNWYLPSIGELAQLYGTDISQMTDSYGTSGAVGDVKSIVNATLTKLASSTALGSSGAAVLEFSLQSSTEIGSNSVWRCLMSTGLRSYEEKVFVAGVRVMLEF